MPNDSDFVDRIKTILSQPARGVGNGELQDLLEMAILSADQETSAFAARVMMLVGSAAFPLIVAGDIDESRLTAAMNAIDEGKIDDSSEELFSILGMTVDDATSLIRKALQLREEARRKSGFTK